MKRLDYSGKLVIVTGASSGIGKGIAHRLIKKYGCVVYAIARNEANLTKAREELGNNSNAFIPYPMDASVKENWVELREKLEKENTPPDILINCAGVLPKFSSFEKSTSSQLIETLNINFLSSVYSCEQLMPLMKRGSSVINISSASALCPFSGVSAYSASKVALERFSECLACERRDITVSTVMPGFVKTEIMKNQRTSEKEKGIISFFSADLEKTVSKILRRAKRRKRRIVVGIDAHFMSFMFRAFPRLAPRLITWFLKKSKLELFKEI